MGLGREGGHNILPGVKNGPPKMAKIYFLRRLSPGKWCAILYSAFLSPWEAERK